MGGGGDVVVGASLGMGGVGWRDVARRRNTLASGACARPSSLPPAARISFYYIDSADRWAPHPRCPPPSHAPAVPRSRRRHHHRLRTILYPAQPRRRLRLVLLVRRRCSTRQIELCAYEIPTTIRPRGWQQPLRARIIAHNIDSRQTDGV